MIGDASETTVLSAVMDAAADAIILSDDQGAILSANPAAERLFGYSADELLGRNVSSLMPQKMAQEHDGYIDHHIRTGEKRIIGLGRDVEGLRKDGSVFPLHLSVGATQAVEGHKTFVGILHDLTQRREAQETLARTQRLDAIGKLTGGIAHDFNNLLTVIIGNLELLEMRNAREDQLPLVNDALEAAELAAELTQRLLVFARKSQLKTELIALEDVATATLAILERTLGEGCVIETMFESTRARVQVDPVQLQTALMNLALNARDAMPDGGKLTISVDHVVVDDLYLERETGIPQGEYLRLGVQDTGCGMDAEAQKLAFEPFFTTKSDTGGTGLGLAMVYGFVRQSDGHLTLYSEVGLGTRFGLYFPVSTAKDTPQGEGAVGAAPVPGRGETILVVEDNAHVRALSLERLDVLGYKTQEASSGDEAYARLKDGLKVDLVFTDLVMPGKLNGYELAKHVARDYPDIKILLTSGYANDVVTNEDFDALTFEVLQKPYRFSELARRLRALLET